MFNLHEICKTANTLLKAGYNRSQAFIKAWSMAKGMVTKVKGVTKENRQTAIRHLLRYNPQDVTIQLQRERDNVYDGNAIAVVAAVRGRGAYKMGYLPAVLSGMIAPLMDAGKAIRSGYQEVRGGDIYPV
jgi:hypothetical protein